MTKPQRIRTFLGGIIMLFLAVLLLLVPDAWFDGIAVFIGLMFAIRGIRSLLYYFSMARYMVGGKAILFWGAILLSVGLFTASLADSPALIIILYLVIVNAFSGLVNLVKAIREFREHISLWKYDAADALAGLSIAIACLLFMHSVHVLVWLYGIGLAYQALLRIRSAFLRTAIVYIP